jgi:uncharacterized membrane protein YphA (DoxX/SURF4 family)
MPTQTGLSSPLPEEPELHTAPEQLKTPSNWHPAVRLAFRFASILLFLIVFPFPFEIDDAPDVLPSFWHHVVPWIATRFVSFKPEQILANVELYFYCQLIAYSLIAFVGMMIWSWLDWKSLSYPRLHAWLRLYFRIYLGAMIFAYGSSKLFPFQFRPPSLARLLQPFGDYDLHGLMWAFMGASRTYTFFAGCVEALAGVLLLIPGLTTLGALVCGAALANVLVLDLAYNVNGPQVYCFMLLLLCGFLVAPDLPRLIRFFVLNRAAEPAVAEPYSHRGWMRRIAVGVQLMFAVFVVAHNLPQDYRDSRNRDEALRNNVLRGIWLVEKFAINNEERPPLTSDPIRWQRVVIDSPPSATLESGVVDLFTIQSMSGSLHSLTMKLDSKNSAISVKEQSLPEYETLLNYSRPEPGLLLLEGRLNGNRIRATLRRSDPVFKLAAERFHWLDERPLDPWNP